MAETMADLWERYRAARVDDDPRAEPAATLLAELRGALAVTGPVYLLGVRSVPDAAAVSVLWLGLGHEDPGIPYIVAGNVIPDPRVAPRRIRGDGTARDARKVPVPGTRPETWRDRPAQF
jgi:hypothetical protein